MVWLQTMANVRKFRNLFECSPILGYKPHFKAHMSTVQGCHQNGVDNRNRFIVFIYASAYSNVGLVYVFPCDLQSQKVGI